MSGVDKPTGRVIALIVLLFLVAAALRGYIPAAAHPTRQQKAENPAALAAVVMLLAVSLVTVAVAFIARVRSRRRVAGSSGALPTGLGGGRGRASWRVVLIAVALLAAWALLIWLLQKAVGQHAFDSVVVLPGEHSDAPAANSAPPPSSTAPRPDEPQAKSGGDMFGYLAATAVGLLLLTAVGVVFSLGRRRSATPPSPGDEPIAPAAGGAPETLARVAELGLAEIGDLSCEPREAIIECYAAMERELAHVPDAAPQDFDTPTEVLARAVEHHALTAANAAKLVNLFAEARFSQHLMTELHRQDAIRILRLVLDELRSRV